MEILPHFRDIGLLLPSGDNSLNLMLKFIIKICRFGPILRIHPPILQLCLPIEHCIFCSKNGFVHFITFWVFKKCNVSNIFTNIGCIQF